MVKNNLSAPQIVRGSNPRCPDLLQILEGVCIQSKTNVVQSTKSNRNKKEIMSKFLTISELEQGDQSHPIWALNGSSESEANQPGEVHVGIPKINGTKVDDLHLPQTWLPVCLTDQIPRAQLLASSEFRNAVNNRLVVLISKEFSQEILQQDGVDEERQRLLDMSQSVRNATQSRTISQSGAEVVSTTELANASRDTPDQADPNELAPSFVMFANTLSDKTDIEALNLIRGRGKFTGKELDHLVSALVDKPKTIEFIREKRAPRR